ncbi:MAG: cation-translocating P-type ATPase [Candidatus Woesearchaeota archaeon]
MFFDKEPEEVFNKLISSDTGLSEDEVGRRQGMYGKNIVFRIPKVKGFPFLIAQFKRVSIYLLLILLFLSVFFGDYLKALVVLPILLFNGYLGYRKMYEYQRTKYLLQELSSQNIKVMRDGNFRSIDSTELVPGDVIYVKTGERVPADARIFEMKDLETSESRITGKYSPVKKSLKLVIPGSPMEKQNNMIFCGSTVTKGYAKAIVVRTGSDTYLGDLMKGEEGSYHEVIPLEKKISRLKLWLERLIGACSLFMLGLAVVTSSEFLQTLTQLEMSIEWLGSLFFSIQDYAYVAVGLSVGAVPAGLANIIGDSLSRGLKLMHKNKIVMRKLNPILNLSFTSALCSDITGVLTEERMTVRKIFANGSVMEVTGKGSEGEILKDGMQVKPHEVDLILKIGMLNNDASINAESYLGDPTELALIMSGAKNNLNKVDLEKKFPRIADKPFDSDRRRMATLHRTKSKNYLFVKGACDTVLDLCTSVIIDGKVQNMTPERKESIRRMNDSFSQEGLRVISFAFRVHPDIDIKEENLIFVGLQAIENPLRKSSQAAITKLEKAGIKHIFVTGEHMNTALAIGSSLGIKGNAINATEIDKAKDLESSIDNISIVARATSAHKLKIVTALRNKGYNVAVTGDSMNDAFTLQKADTGISMGGSSDIAKEASDAVIEDNSFFTIVKGIGESKGINENIQKFLMSIFSGNLAMLSVLLVPVLLSLLFGRQFIFPLQGIHILWIAFIADGLLSYMMLHDPVRPSIMGYSQKSFDRRSMIDTVIIALMIYGLTAVIMSVDRFPYTMVFTALVLFQFVKVLIVRMKHKVWFFSNKNLWLAMLLIVSLQGLIVYVPFLQPVFGTVPLAVDDLLLILASATGLFVLGLIFSFVRRKDI